MWKGFYDILIKAQKLEHKGRLAEIEGDDGVINLTFVVFADGTVHMGWERTMRKHIKDRGTQLPRNSAIMPDATRTLENRSWEH